MYTHDTRCDVWCLSILWEKKQQMKIIIIMNEYTQTNTHVSDTRNTQIKCNYIQKVNVWVFVCLLYICMSCVPKANPSRPSVVMPHHQRCKSVRQHNRQFLIQTILCTTYYLLTVFHDVNVTKKYLGNIYSCALFYSFFSSSVSLCVCVSRIAIQIYVLRW